MKKSIKISVVIPVYNAEDYIVPCLESILSQMDDDTELLIINDGSTDHSGDLCLEYAKKYPDVRVLEQENRGPSAARNRGICVAEGIYIAFVDADDLVAEDFISTIKENSKNQEKWDVLYYSAVVQNEIGFGACRGEYERAGDAGDGIEMSGREYLERVYPYFYIVSPVLAAYKKDFLRNNGIEFPEGLLYEDNVFQLRVLLAAKKVKILKAPLYIRRYRPDSIMTGKMTRRKYEDQKKICRMCWQEIRCAQVSGRLKDRFCACSFLQTVDRIWPYLCEDRSRGLDLAESYKNCCVEEESLPALLASFFAAWIREDTCSWKGLEKRARKVRKEIDRQMKAFPLHERRKQIGIYGCGASAQGFLHLYEYYVGTIEAELFYVVTEKTENSFREKRVVAVTGVREMEAAVDGIILSSLRYREEMWGKLNEAAIDSQKVIDPYEENDSMDYAETDHFVRRMETCLMESLCAG